jgi:hypothetical protein
MTLERIVLALLVLVGILMCVFAVIGAMYWGLLLPYAVFLVMGGVALIILTIVVYFLIL